MSLVALGGDDAARPTYFELIAAQGLVPSIKAALVYSLSVYSQRRPFLHSVLNYEDELFALVSLFLEQQSLWYSDATLAESLYGLKRARQRIPLSDTPQNAPKGTAPLNSAALRRDDRWRALLLAVAAPYLRCKLEAMYQQWRPPEGALQGPPGIPSTPSELPSSTNAPPSTHRTGSLQHNLHSIVQRWTPRFRRWFVQAYPWLHAAVHGAGLAYQLGYLLGLTEYWNPVLAVLGQRLERVTGQEVAQKQQALQHRRALELQGAGSPAGPLSVRVRRCWIRGRQFMADNTRTVVISAVFLYKLLEWWYTSAEQQLAAQRKLPPPPPPPEPQLHPQGLVLPWDVTLCPLCCKPRTNPTMLTVSGYVFCYPCLHKYLEKHQRCPVTWRPATSNHVRRLYQDA